MKYNKIIITSLALALSAVGVQPASADSGVVAIAADVNVTGKGTLKSYTGTDNSASASVGASASASASSSKSNNGNGNNGGSTGTSASSSASASTSASSSSSNGNAYGRSSSTASTTGEIKSAEHRSVVANFVHSLLNLANRSSGIGAQVSAVAKSQNDSATTTADAMSKIEARGSFRTFLFGSDYKSIGIIRSEIATTTANIAKLKEIASSTTDVSAKAELNAQIAVLEAENAKLEAYIKAHMDDFGIFGWLNRIIND